MCAAAHARARVDASTRAGMSRVDVFLDAVDSKYRAGDVVRGEVVATIEREDAPFNHQGVVVTACGSVAMRVGEGRVTMLEALFTSVDPVSVLDVQ